MAARDLTRNTPTEDQKQSKVGEDTSGLPARQQHRFDSTPHDSTSARPSEASTAANEDQSPNDKSSAVVGSEDDFGAGDDKDGLVKSTILQADYGYIVSFPGVCEIAISIFALIALILCVVPYQWGPQFGYFLFAAVFTLSSAMVLLFTKVCLATHHVKLFYRIYVSDPYPFSYKPPFQTTQDKRVNVHLAADDTFCLLFIR